MISLAHAQTAATAAQQPGGWMAYLPFIVLIIVFWFLMIRPQMKRAKEHKKLVESLAKGDEVVTQGGIAGRVVQIGEQYLLVESSANVQLTLQREAVVAVLPKGTLKSAL
ncbi:MAG: preprotein translocase subunit YajC [Zoogloeaceae bacterium]|nr:preprotein translocase subunit YajC [Zoogloeaceae bacterium]